MSNRIIRNLPDSKYKAVVGNTLAGGSNPFGTESEITDQVTESEIVNGLNVGIKNTNVDAAYIATDGIYRMPTKTECDELINNCTWTWSTQNGVNGYTVEGNGNSIFIPASGYRNGASLLNDGTEGYLWTDTFIDEWAFMVMFSSSQHNTNGSTSRYYGRTIRPVSSIEGVDLGLPSGLKWASVNIGATLPEDYGDYFAWAETETKESFTSENYICPSGSKGTELDPVTHVTKYSLVNILHKNNPNIHTSPEKEARWEGKQDALGFIPENSANKKTSLAENSDTYYPTQKAVKTAVDSLNSIINQIGANATYKGEAIPSTNPGTPDALVFYITSTQGTYANFGGFVLDGGFAVLSNVTGSWTGTKFLKTELDAKANQNELDQLANEINNTIFQTEDGEFSIEDVFGNKSLGITNDGKLFFSKITSETIAYLNSVINGGGVAFIDKIRNKKVAILGDSISTDTGGGNANLVYPQQYWGLLGQLQGCTIYRNAIGGTTITQGGQGTPFVNDARWQSLDSNFIPDVIIVFGGINDFLQDIPLGVSTDTVTTTFYGALDYLYRNLLSTYTSTRIFHMTPLHTTFYQAGGLIPEFNGINYLSEYIDAIYHVARRYGVSIIDTNRDSGISCFNIDLLSDDNIHVKAVGHEMIYNTIINYTNLSL